SGADAPPAGAYRTVRIPSRRAPWMSDAMLSPTIAVAAGSSPRRSSAIRKSGGSGFPTTNGRTPAATATASTSAPHPGRNSPPSSGNRGSTFGVTSGAPDVLRGRARVVGEERETATRAVEGGQRLARPGVQGTAVPDAAVQVEDETAHAGEDRARHEG